MHPFSENAILLIHGGEHVMGCNDHSGRSYRIVIVCGFFFLFLIACVIYSIKQYTAVTVLRFSETEPAFSQADDTFHTMEPLSNPYPDLSVPTLITKIDGIYFIVDCYHDQIIYSDSLDRPLYEWNVMTDEISKGHTLASDGLVYLADDTENNRILIFEKKEGKFVHTQTFSDIGIRPHYIVYNEKDRCFYAWSSMTGEMYILRREEDSSRVFLSEIRQIPSLNGVYVRSFTIMDNDIYFVSGNSSIIRADLHSFRIREEFPVPDSIAGMIQLTWIDGYYYITVSTDKQGSQNCATIIRTKDLKNLAASDYEDVYASFIGGGTPYYISYFDNCYYLTEHRLPGHSVWRFQSTDGQLTDVTSIY